MPLKRTKLTYASLLAFLVFLLAGGLGLARPLSLIFESVRHEAIFLPAPPAPALFLPLAMLWAILGYLVIHTHLIPKHLPRPLAVAFLLLCSGLVILRMQPIPLQPLSPAERAVKALDRVEAILGDLDLDAQGLPAAFPDGKPLLDPGGSPLLTGYLGRGQAIPFRVISLVPGPGPQLQARAADPPGTIYYRIDDRRGDRYFLTVLVLGAHPVGPIRFLRQSNGQPELREGTLLSLQ